MHAVRSPWGKRQAGAGHQGPREHRASLERSRHPFKSKKHKDAGLGRRFDTSAWADAASRNASLPATSPSRPRQLTCHSLRGHGKVKREGCAARQMRLARDAICAKPQSQMLPAAASATNCSRSQPNSV